MKTSEVISILMKSIDKEIEFVIDNRYTKFCFGSYVRGFHVYQTVWSPIIGEENLECRRAGYGFEIPVIDTFNGHEKAIEWIKSKIQEDMKLEQSMKNRCLK